LDKALQAGVDMILVNCFDYDKMTQDVDKVTGFMAKIPADTTVFLDCRQYGLPVVDMIRKHRIKGIFMSNTLFAKENIVDGIMATKRLFDEKAAI